MDDLIADPNGDAAARAYALVTSQLAAWKGDADADDAVDDYAFSDEGFAEDDLGLGFALIDSSSSSSSVDADHARLLEYHDAAVAWRAARRTDPAGADADLLRSATRAAAGSAREVRLWTLLRALRRREPEDAPGSMVLFEELSSSSSSSSVVDPREPPAAVLRRLLSRDGGGDPAFARRLVLLDWISSCCRPATRPPSSRDVGRPVTASRGLPVDPDRGGNDEGALPGTDEADECDLLAAVLRCVQRGDFDAAADVCAAAGQPWRSATFAGGLDRVWRRMVTSRKDKTKEDGDNDDDDDVESLWNPHYFLWKETCSKLAHHAQQRADDARADRHPATLYEAALYSLLSGDLSLSLRNPLLRTWEDQVHAHLRASVHRTVDEALLRHARARRRVARRLPFRDVGHPAAERTLESRTADAASLDEAAVFDRVAVDDGGREEASDALREFASAVAVGRDAAADFCARYAAEDRDPRDAAVATHAVLLLDALSDDARVAAAAQELAVAHARSELWPTPRLWRCVPFYASLVTDDARRADELATFLRRVTRREQREELLRLVRERCAEGTDGEVVRSLLEEAIANAKEDATSVRQDMAMIQWVLVYPEQCLEALCYANVVLRRLLLASENDPERLSLAEEFLRDHVPDDSADLVLARIRDLDDENHDDRERAHDAVDEHEALRSYVDAHAVHAAWRRALARAERRGRSAAAAGTSVVAGLTPARHRRLNAVERDVAEAVAARERRRATREDLREVVGAAGRAEEAWGRVLECPGGWLVGERGGGSSEGAVYERLRRACLPRAVFALRVLYDETGAWTETLNEDDATPGADAWYRRSLSLVNTVADEEFAVGEAFSIEQTKEFLTMMRNSAVKLLRVEKDEERIMCAVSLDERVEEEEEDMDEDYDEL